MLTKKAFEIMAYELRNARPGHYKYPCQMPEGTWKPTTWDYCIMAVCTALARDNPRFNVEIFLEAVEATHLLKFYRRRD